jgi:hypothetical protein
MKSMGGGVGLMNEKEKHRRNTTNRNVSKELNQKTDCKSD